MPVLTKEPRSKPDINEQLRRLNKAAGMTEPPRRNSALLVTLGVMQMLAGLFSIVFSYMAGTLFSVFMGAVLTAAGIFQMIAGGVFRSRTALLIGALGTAAGIFILANPVISLAVIGAILGAFLVITGAFNMASAGKQGTSAMGGMIEIGIGVLVLLGVFGMGLLIGLYLLIRGAVNYQAGRAVSKAPR